MWLILRRKYHCDRAVRPGSTPGSGRVTTCRFRCRSPLFRGGGGVGSFRGRGQCGLADRSLVVREMYWRQEGQWFRLDLRDAPNPCRAHRRMHDFAVSTRSASGEGTACARSWACLLRFFSVSLDIPSSPWRSLCRLRHRPAGAPPHRRRFGSNEWRSEELCPVLIAYSYSSFQNSPVDEIGIFPRRDDFRGDVFEWAYRGVA